MAPLKAFLDSLEGLDESLHKYYIKQDDGKYKLDAEGIEDVTGLKSALASERELKRKAEKQLKAFADAGIEDPAAAAEAIAKVEELSSLDPEKEADKIAAEKVKAQSEQLIAKHKEELGKKDEEAKNLRTQLEKHLIDAEATGAIAEAKGAVSLLLPIVRDQTRLRQSDNGEFSVEVLDATGTPRIGDTAGKPMTIVQLVAEMKASESYGRAFDGTGASGSGSETGTGTGKETPAGKVSLSDQDALNKSIEDIASGKTEVVSE